MRTLEEEIAHSREVARVNRFRTKHPAVHRNDRDEIEACLLCAEEHEQLADLLEELKAYRTLDKTNFSDGYNKAIDDFSELLKGNLIRKYANANLTQQYVALQVTDWCNEIAKQLKEEKQNE